MALLPPLVPSTLPRSPISLHSTAAAGRHHHRRLQARGHSPRARVQAGERTHVGLCDTSGCAPQHSLDRRFALDAPLLRPKNTWCQQLGAGDTSAPGGTFRSGAGIRIPEPVVRSPSRGSAGRLASLRLPRAQKHNSFGFARAPIGREM
jgi:hypothetical protein